MGLMTSVQPKLWIGSRTSRTNCKSLLVTDEKNSRRDSTAERIRYNVRWNKRSWPFLSWISNSACLNANDSIGYRAAFVESLEAVQRRQASPRQAVAPKSRLPHVRRIGLREAQADPLQQWQRGTSVLPRPNVPGSSDGNPTLPPSSSIPSSIDLS
ncbi:hypothetical protein CONLIGDRAFT_489011 [Coniochaeta ligniaria NRRL 30616]|uniref:Uncharacterized protein n=1 Tax=Coniochaeta ligniaria NRRL 30616 TaxID=1408157 RepID=A0A1J7IHE3_9PEZI|nr:hypothetical protein CONLIGDRAFT_489011 [Coniochaeta ligniaria NRRL 30616]